MDRIPGREKSNSDGSDGSANATLACHSLSPQLSIMANSPQLETRLFRLLSLSDMTDKFYRIAESVSRDRRKTPPDDGPPWHGRRHHPPRLHSRFSPAPLTPSWKRGLSPSASSFPPCWGSGGPARIPNTSHRIPGRCDIQVAPLPSPPPLFQSFQTTICNGKYHSKSSFGIA